MAETIEYEKLRLDILRKMIDERDIPYKNNKDEIIKLLILDDNEKYIRETVYLKDGKGYIVGIDIKNKKDLQQIHKLIEKHEARRLNRYCDNRLQYWSPQKLL